MQTCIVVYTAQDIIKNLKGSKSTLKGRFCDCHRTANAEKSLCANQFRYPTCGGKYQTLTWFGELPDVKLQPIAQSDSLPATLPEHGYLAEPSLMSQTLTRKMRKFGS